MIGRVYTKHKNMILWAGTLPWNSQLFITTTTLHAPVDSILHCL